MELDTGRFERQSAIVQHPPHAALQVVDDVLVVHAQHASGQGLVPMAHQVEIGAVVAGDILGAVGELLPLREQLLEVAEAAGHRLAPGVDDLRVRQHQVDQADVAEIVRHLVDEERLAGAVDLGVRQIGLAQLAGVLGRQVRERGGIAGIVMVGVAALQAQHDALDIRQLLGALDLGMRGQDLFEQGGARPGQAEDEDRVRARIAPVGALVEESAGADLALLARIGLEQLGAIAAFRALQRVAALVVEPGLGCLAAILQRFAERETHVVAVGQGDGGRRFLGAHALDLVLLEPIGLEIGQAPIGVAEVGPRRRRRAIGLDRLRNLADGLQRMAGPQRHVPGAGRVLAQSRIEGQRLVVLTQTHGAGGGQDPVVDIGRIDLQQPLDLLAGRLMLLPLDQRFGIVVARRPVIGLQGQDGLQEDVRVVQRIVRQGDARQQAHGFGMIALGEQEVPRDALGKAQVAVGKQRGCGDHLRWQGLERRHVLGGGFGVLGVTRHPIETVEHLPAHR